MKKKILSFCLLLCLLTIVAVNGTLAFLQEQTNTVTNTFQAGNITYTLKLMSNASDVTMPEDLNAKESSALAAVFTPNRIPTKTGYSFGGWYYDSEGKSVYPYVNENQITVNYGDTNDRNSAANKVEITLYAKWIPNTYTVEYDGNGSTGGSTSSSSHTYGVEEPLTANGYTRTGYTFAGWNANEHGIGTSYSDGQIVKNLTTEDNATVTLYAQWTPNTDTEYKVEYFLQNVDGNTYTKAETDSESFKGTTGDIAKPTPKEYEGFKTPDIQEAVISGTGSTVIKYYYDRNKYTVTLSAGTGIETVTGAGEYLFGTKIYISATVKEGYNWVNWTGKYTESQKDFSYYVEAADASFTANATANKYTVVYDGNGSTSGSTSSSSHTYGVEKPLTANGYTRTGYTFAGWTTNEDGTGTLYRDKDSVKNLTTENNATVTLYAKWAPNTYTVEYNGNGSTGGSTSSSSHTYGVEKPLTANGYTRTGYTFAGWNTQADGKGTSYVDKTKVTNLATGGSITLYAKWTANTYKVNYNANGGEGSTATSTHTYGVASKLTTNGFSRKGYAFNGWTTNQNGSGTSYLNEASVINLTSVAGGNVTLYAQWLPRAYTIRYHANGGEGVMNDQVVKYDNVVSLSENQFTKTNYTFAGWATTATADKATYIDKQEIVNLLEEGTLNLYAVWKQNTVRISFDYNGGVGSPDSMEIEQGQAYGTLPTYPTKGNYLFGGWYTERNGGTRVTNDTIANSNRTLYAHWIYAPSNNIIQNLVVKNNPDNNSDGIVDDIYLKFSCSGLFEKYNIPIEPSNGLVPGVQYKLTYTVSNNAQFGDNETNYNITRYGSYVLEEATFSSDNINNSQGVDVISNWNHTTKGNAWLNAPQERTIIFTATEEKMYWTWDFGLFKDGIICEVNISNIKLEINQPIVPEIMFGNKVFKQQDPDNRAKYVREASTYKSTNFTLYSALFSELFCYPITGLTSGETYSITFDHKFTGNRVNSSVTPSAGASSSWDYGCGISSNIPEPNNKMNPAGNLPYINANWLSTTQPILDQSGAITSVTLTFTATGNTAYWVWNLTDTADWQYATVDVNVTRFSRGSTLYAVFSDTSIATLEWRPEKLPVPEIELIWDGIDDTNMDNWYPVDEQHPIADDDYELAFEPSEGYTMSETIIVEIDGVTYTVYTDGSRADDEIAPYYDPERNILTIPAELLTEETKTVTIIASAEEIVIKKATDSNAEKIEVIFEVANVASPSNAIMKVGEDYKVVLTPEEGYELTECFYIEMNDALYEVYTDGQETLLLMGEENEDASLPTFNPERNILTIPSSMIFETTENVIISVYAVEIEESEEETLSPEGKSEESGEETPTPEDESEEAGEETPTPEDEPEEPEEETLSPEGESEEPVEETPTPEGEPEEPVEETPIPEGEPEEPMVETPILEGEPEKTEEEPTEPVDPIGLDLEGEDALLPKEEEFVTDEQETPDNPDDSAN